jgi:uncharacterized protein YidB (DUF937 family)
MGLLDSLMKNSGILENLGKLGGENPQLAQAAMSLFSSNDSTVGGSGGLGGILNALKGQGLEDVVSSWLGGGGNKAISPSQLESALGSDTISQFASKAGVGGAEASAVLAGLLPELVDSLSPKGDLPDAGSMEGLLKKVLGG